MLKVSPEGRVIYRAEHGPPRRYPMPAQPDLFQGVSRNFQMFDPLDFLAELTQHIPNKGEHLTRYYRYYSNKSRGMRAKAGPATVEISTLDDDDPDTPHTPPGTHELGRAHQAGL